MGKKKSRKSRTSLGREGHPKKCRISLHGTMTRALNQQKAWLAGKNVVLTVPNPDSTATNARFIKMNARDVWGLPPSMRRKESNAG